MSELPNGWDSAAIADVTASITQKVPNETEQFLYIDIASIDRETKLISEPQSLLGKDAPSRARKEVKAGDVLVSMTRPNLNAVALVGHEFDGNIASTGFDVLRPIEIEPRWLFAQVRGKLFIDAMSELVQGALYPAVKSADVRSFEILIPPLNEQKRIADKLDRLLARVDAAKARLDKIPAILKRLRQAVLVAATTGKLTEEWRLGTDNTENEWATAPLESVCIPKRVITYGVIKLGEEITDGVPCLRTSNVRWLNVDTDGMKRISPSLSEDYSRTILQGAEVLVNVRGTLGGVAVVTPEMVGWNVSREVAVVPVDTNKLNPYFLAYLIGSDASQRWLTGVQKGVAYVGINIEDLRTLPVALPSMDEQKEVIRRVEELFAIADHIEAQYCNARARVDRLTQSLLAKAFRGELVSQDPTDEPASALLERIAAQRASTPKPKRGRRKKGA